MDNKYSTKDLSEAAFLYATDLKLLGLREDAGRVWFCFENRPACEKLATSFWQKEAMVNAKDFADALRTLKDLLFNRGMR